VAVKEWTAPDGTVINIKCPAPAGSRHGWQELPCPDGAALDWSLLPPIIYSTPVSIGPDGEIIHGEPEPGFNPHEGE
jgi:hypothetical protein